MVKRIAIRLSLFFAAFVVIIIANLLIFNMIARKVSEGEPILNRDPERVALLVIDIQEGTTGSVSITDGYINQAESLISGVNELVAMAEEEGWSIIWIRSEVVNPLINIINSTLAKGSPGAELDRRLDTAQGQVVVKRRNDSFVNTPLDSILAEQRIGSLVVAGLDAESCVLTALQAAANRGYALSVYEETVIAREKAVMPGVLDTYVKLGVDLRSLE